jgi:MFS transporter, OFA family, oxalate/formate antiporter
VWGTTAPILFVILTGIVFFARGEIYSLFPSTCGDTYVSRHAAANAGWLDTAKGAASLLVSLTSELAEMFGDWG